MDKYGVAGHYQRWRQRIRKRSLTLRDKGATHCAICGVHAYLVLDHCHTTGWPRDMICQRCNAGLGFFGDNRNTMRAAIEYLKRHEFLAHEAYHGDF